jgi:hypothetical protein
MSNQNNNSMSIMSTPHTGKIKIIYDDEKLFCFGNGGESKSAS